MTNLYGAAAEFETADRLADAVAKAREARYTALEAYSPYPVEEIRAELGRGKGWLAGIVLAAGFAGGAIGYGIEWYTNVADYPINVGGRPLHSWPAFTVVAFEAAVLFAALAAVVAMLVLNGLPRLNHPMFNVPRFGEASQTRFFLCIRADDPHFDPVAVRDFLNTLNPAGVWEVPR